MTGQNEKAIAGHQDISDAVIAQIRGYFQVDGEFLSHATWGMYPVYNLKDSRYIGIFQKMVFAKPLLFVPDAVDALTIVQVDPNSVDLELLAKTGHINFHGNTHLGKINGRGEEIYCIGKRDNIFHAVDTGEKSRLQLIPREGHPFQEEVVSYYKERTRNRPFAF